MGRNFSALTFKEHINLFCVDDGLFDSLMKKAKINIAQGLNKDFSILEDSVDLVKQSDKCREFVDIVSTRGFFRGLTPYQAKRIITSDVATAYAACALVKTKYAHLGERDAVFESLQYLHMISHDEDYTHIQELALKILKWLDKKN